MTPDELTALCDEMVSLSRAGVPLDRGLIQLAGDLPKRMSAQAREVGEKLQAGMSLADVVAEDSSPFPAVYKSVVEAGLRSGKLSSALEGFSRISRQIAEVRRLVITSLVYPLFLLLLLFLISFGLLGRFGAIISGSMIAIQGRGAAGTETAALMRKYAVWSEWFWVIPGTLLVLSLLWFALAMFTRGSAFAEWIPGVGRLLRNSRLMAFTEVLSLLIRQRVPLGESIRLAGETSGDRRLSRDAKLLAEQIERGDSAQGNVQSNAPESGKSVRNVNGGIPPFIRWSLTNSQRTNRLEATLDRATETYKKRTEVASVWLRKTFPIMLSAALGGVVVFMYAALVFLPWYTMLQSLSKALETI